MRVRLLWLVLVSLLIPSVGRADDHKADFAAAFCFANGSTLFGTQVTFAKTLAQFGDHHPFSWVGDLSVHTGTEEDEAGEDNNATRIAYMTGVRYMLGWSPGANRFYVQGLFGAVHNHVGAPDYTDPAVAAGIGYEYRGRHAPRESGMALRAQVEIVHLFSDSESLPEFIPRNFPRVSVGIVYRIGN